MSDGLNDRALANLYVEFAKRYAQYKKNCTDEAIIYNNLLWYIHEEINSGKSVLSKLKLEDRDKPYRVLHAFLKMQPVERPISYFVYPHPPIQEIRIIIEDNRYNSNDFLSQLILLNAIQTSSYNTSRNHQHKSEDIKADDFFKIMALLALFLAIVLTAIALYYILQAFIDNIERFYFNEGWLRASLFVATQVAAITTMSILSATIFTGPFIYFFAALGLTNPFVAAVITSICITAVAALMVMSMFELIAPAISGAVNQDKLIPADPYRFGLSAAEEEAFLKRNIDPIKIKCAIMEIIAKNADADGLYFNFFDKNSKKIALKVRELKEYGKIDIAGMRIDCHFTESEQTHYAAYRRDADLGGYPDEPPPAYSAC